MPSGISVTYSVAPLPECPPASIRVEGFGRVREATIELAPLTILVGKNNTGKSYIAYLLWAMRSSAWGKRGQPYLGVPAPDWFRAYVETARESGERPLEISAEVVSPYINKWLAENANDIASDILSVSGTQIGKLELSFSGSVWLFPRSEHPEWFNKEHFDSLSLDAWGFSWSNEFNVDKESGLVTVSDHNAADLLFSMSVEKLLFKSITGHMNRSAYLPAARTGLVLAIRELAASVMDAFSLSSDKAEFSQFSRPMVSFLTSLVRGGNETRENLTTSIAEFLENNILVGHIETEGRSSPSFFYKPSGTDVRLPMHAVSSMVSELTPFIRLLRTGQIRDGLVIEEPEAHLHLSAQRCMARALVKLVNLGIPVTITTHSDTFLQQINLLMQIYSHPKREDLLLKLGYAEDELLDPSKAIAYEFISNGGGTNVVLAEKTSDGFVIESLNETLFELANIIVEVAEL